MLGIYRYIGVSVCIKLKGGHNIIIVRQPHLYNN